MAGIGGGQRRTTCCCCCCSTGRGRCRTSVRWHRWRRTPCRSRRLGSRSCCWRTTALRRTAARRCTDCPARRTPGTRWRRSSVHRSNRCRQCSSTYRRWWPWRIRRRRRRRPACRTCSRTANGRCSPDRCCRRRERRSRRARDRQSERRTIARRRRRRIFPSSSSSPSCAARPRLPGTPGRGASRRWARRPSCARSASAPSSSRWPSGRNARAARSAHVPVATVRPEPRSGVWLMSCRTARSEVG